MKDKRQLINAIFVPTLCYECQTWTLTKKHVRKVTTCEMKCLRKAANKTRRDRVRNEDIRKLVGVTPVMDFVNKQQLKWFGHLMRMPVNHPAVRAYNGCRSGSRPRGHPRKRWIDGIRTITDSIGLTTTEATQRAKDRRLFLPATPARV